MENGWQEVRHSLGSTVTVPPGSPHHKVGDIEVGNTIQIYYLPDQWLPDGHPGMGVAGSRIIGYRINGASEVIRMPVDEYGKQMEAAYREAKAADPTLRYFAFYNRYTAEHPVPKDY